MSYSSSLILFNGAIKLINMFSRDKTLPPSMENIIIITKFNNSIVLRINPQFQHWDMCLPPSEGMYAAQNFGHPAPMMYKYKRRCIYFKKKS